MTEKEKIIFAEIAQLVQQLSPENKEKVYCYAQGIEAVQRVQKKEVS